jgi:hypothetical protein
MAKVIDGAVSRTVNPYSNYLAWARESDVDGCRKGHSCSIRDIITNPSVKSWQAAKSATRADDQENISTNKMLARKSSCTTLSAAYVVGFLTVNDLPRMRKDMKQMLSEDPTRTPRVLKRSDTNEAAMVKKKAAAYGGTVKSCARSPSNPNPSTMVGAKRDKEPIRQPTPMYAA